MKPVPLSLNSLLSEQLSSSAWRKLVICLLERLGHYQVQTPPCAPFSGTQALLVRSQERVSVNAVRQRHRRSRSQQA